MQKQLLRTFTLAAATLTVSACATTSTGRRQLAFMPESTMASMGVQAFQQIKDEGKVETDPATNAYVKCVAKAVLDAMPDQDYAAWDVVVFQDETPNAFALPGNKIGVHTGILPVASTQAQLAAIMGHEVGHVLLHHGNERASQTVLAQTALSAGAIALSDMEEGKRDAVLGTLGIGAQVGILLPFSRTHETEADEVGQQFMAKAGFNPQEAVTLWENMAKLSEGQAPPEFLSTHPASASRIKALNKGLATTTPIYNEALAAGRSPECTVALPPSAK